MHAENFIINKSSNWHTVKDILEFFPEADTIPVLALVIETIDSINLTALVITAQQEEILLKFNLVGEKQYNSFKGLLASVNIVTEEKVVGLWWVASILKQTEQISKLTVHVTYTRV